ncbi:hypothetical protein MMC28_008138 [Mycoblastus sanguinarius]|nr:hypothetical protein [Mycoblastus sanguinarius]
METFGMNVLVNGDAPVTADIIFVHGLRGHPLKTWTKDNVVWPRDLLKAKIQNARIMSWGYDAQVANFFDKSGQCSIFDHAQQLLQDISMERTAPNEKERPMFFVAHSLGGLVVKDVELRLPFGKALCISHAESKEEPVLNPRIAIIKSATKGVVFLGTPHRGSNKARWACVATNLMGVLQKDHNSKVTDALVRGAETLERIQTNFNKFLITLPVWSFFEDQQYEKIGKIVDDDSATLGFPHEQKGWIPANHENMIKFNNVQDIGYKRISFAISTLVEDGLLARQAAPSRNGISG